MASRERDAVSNTETTGHEWDGIKELNTPLPRWWLWTFYGTIVWALAYAIAYPSLPLLAGSTPGVLGYSSRSEVAKDIEKAKLAQGDLLNKVAQLPLEDVRKDPELLQFAQSAGRAAFRINCIQCHGSGAAGGKGYPNLNDDDWLWGGTLDQIHATLQHGVRFMSDDATRQSLMPAFGADGILTSEQIDHVAEFVLKLSGQTHDEPAASQGGKVYAENCASCHGDKGEGNRDFGAPRLDDAIWLYSPEKDTIVAQINRPRQGVMPAWSGRLDETTIKELAVFVHSLGGGEAASP
jgi:cytochrome c oxidase cbb3-type subunit 3